MEKRNFRKSMLAILLGVLLYHTAVLAEVDKLNISQILQKGNDVYLYVNSLDAAERPAEDVLLAEQLSVNIDGGEAVPVQEAAIFQSLGQGISYTFCIDVSKSVTEQEMAEIREGITGLINGMSEKDFARIITVGGEVTPLCDYTQDKEALTGAVQNVQRTADFTYLYKGISFALDGYRKSVETMPERGALILFTDGMDDSDGASSEEQVLLDLAETRIPVYVVGLKGNDASANLNSVGQIARQSGGSVYSYSDMAIGEAVQAIGEVMRNTYQLHVRPGDDAFGKQNLVWNATYHPESYSVTSKNYVYSLGMENVVLTTPEPIPEPASEPASEPAPAPETEEESVAEPTPAPETEEESVAEPTPAPV
ncbi:MAG: VWA domain-containing protein [Eubacteriales bacterium]|nr:VWA domain-containing protein [Eubacteriales bacterium]